MKLDDEIRREFDRATDEFRLVFYNGIRKIAESDEEEHPDVEDIVFTDEDGSIGDETEITDDSSDEDDKE